MTEPERTTVERLAITVTDVDLPSDETIRDDVLADLRAAVRDRLAAHDAVDMDRTDVSVTTGHQYASLPAACPCCGTALDRQSIHMDDGNGAFVSVVCPSDECRWSGDAVYRIVDLQGSETDAFESSVLAGHARPRYHPYEGSGPR